MAEPVRLNPNQFLSYGRRKVPNRVYAWLIQSACGWGEDDSAIMSSLISFIQAGRQAGLLGGVGAGGMPTATRHGWVSSVPYNMAVKGFTGENTGPKPWARGTGEDRKVMGQRKLEDGKTMRLTNRKSLHWVIKQCITEQRKAIEFLREIMKSV